MKEITRVITVRITTIGEITDDNFMTKEKCAEFVKDKINDIFDVDNVTVDNIQDFIMEKDGENK